MGSSKILVAQLGARKHYQEPLLFHQWNILDRLYTDLYAGHSVVAELLRMPRVYHYLPKPLKQGLDRYEPDLKKARVVHFPRFGYQYTQALKRASPEQNSRVFVAGGKEFCQRILQRGLGRSNTIYGFNSACLELFEYAKEKGIRCILDQTLADYSVVYQLLLEEEQYWPDWSLTPFTVNEADLELMQREHKEQDLADHIVCGSSFVKDSLTARGVDSNKITVIPLGRIKDEKALEYKIDQPAAPEKSRPLNILFVGSVNLRKGVPYLLEALRQLQGRIPFSCKIAGSIEIRPERVAEYRDVADFLGRVPRSQVTSLYQWADVMVLPSLCEGSAMVTYEALCLGVPVVTTYNAGSIIRPEVDGSIIPIRKIEEITSQLLKLYQVRIDRYARENTQAFIKQLFFDAQQQLKYIVDPQP